MDLRIDSMQRRSKPAEKDGTGTKPYIYHEKQSRELCALHALNNLFQKRKMFTKSELDNICLQLSPDNLINPHRSVFGLGNYDVNVIMAAVRNRSFETVWFDKRRDINKLVLENIVGFILNIPTVHIRMIHRKHWIAVRKVEDKYYNLDSKLDTPEVIGDEQDVLQFLRGEIDSKEKELLLVVTEEIGQKKVWYYESPTVPTAAENNCQQKS